LAIIVKDWQVAWFTQKSAVGLWPAGQPGRLSPRVHRRKVDLAFFGGGRLELVIQLVGADHGKDNFSDGR